MTQVPLFDEPAPVPKHKRASRRPTGIAYTKRDTKAKRVLCEDCIEAIHRLGIANAPLPLASRWIRHAADEPNRYVCDPHKTARTEVGR